MSNYFCRTLRIDRKDLSLTIYVFFFYFLVILSYYLIKPTKDALFIQYMGAESMPLAFIIIPAFTLLFLFLYDFLVRKLTRKKFSSILLIFFISNLLIIWILFKIGLKKEAAYTLYVWSDIFSVATVTLFWSITNDIYTSEGAKRVYGFFGLGSQIGGVLGSFITQEMVKFTETEYLLPLSSIIILIIIFIIIKIDSIDSHKDPEKLNKKEILTPPKKKGYSEVYQNFMLIIKSKYLLYFTLLLCVMLTTSNLMNYQIGRVIQESIIDKDGKTAYMANLYFWSNALSFIFLLFATLFYKYFGIFGTLYLAPVINLITISGFTIVPSLMIISITRVLDGGLKYGISQVTREMLYIPCTKEEKYRAKAVIDILFYRLVKVFSALLMIIFTSWIVLSMQMFNIIIIVILLINLWVLYKLRLSFIKSLETKIVEAFEEYNDILPKIKENERIETEFNETKIMKALIDKIKGNIAPGQDRINALRIIETQLPEIAPAGQKVYNNLYIEKAILIISQLNMDDNLYSICMQYLNIALPRLARRKYTLLLANNIPTKKILKLAGTQ